MKKHQRWIAFTVVLIMLGITGVAVVAIAAPGLPWESSNEPGTFPSTSTRTNVILDAPDEGQGRITNAPVALAADAPNSTDGHVPINIQNIKPTELQPDDDGYTGPLPLVMGNNFPPSANADALTPPNWSTSFTEPQPDDIVDGGITDDAEINWSPLYYYYHAAGSAFRPRDSSVDWGNDGSGGCLYLTTGSTGVVFNIPLDIPDGVRIEYLRIYYYDASASTSQAWVTRYDDEGSLEDVTYVASAGDTGYGTQLGTYLEHVVNMTDYSYVLNWRPNATGNTMQLCGLRVAYRLPD